MAKFPRLLTLSAAAMIVVAACGGGGSPSPAGDESLGESRRPWHTDGVLEATPRVRTAASPANPPVLSDQAGHTVARLLARREARSTEVESPCPSLP